MSDVRPSGHGGQSDQSHDGRRSDRGGDRQPTNPENDRIANADTLLQCHRHGQRNKATSI